MFNQDLSKNTALTAVLTYRVIGSQALLHERYTPTQRDVLQARIDEFRAYQAQDAQGRWIPNTYDKEGLIDYMVVSFEEPSNKPSFFVTYPSTTTK